LEVRQSSIPLACRTTRAIESHSIFFCVVCFTSGYLAFIGYFCVQAGVALCISRPLISIRDWAYLGDPDNILLAFPGLLAGLVLTVVSRIATNDVILPGLMVLIPVLFYVGIYAAGTGLDGAREGHWVGEVAPPVPVRDLFTLVDFSLVQWDLVGEILWTWVGMVFVVSFASCLDVAAISMDKGEALDTNRELATVGIGNLMSGLSFG
jgi:sulfate permease, SulP family